MNQSCYSLSSDLGLQVTLATDLKAGSGAPWAGHWRLTGVILREAMVWATNPESFGLAPPTGSEEERCQEAHIGKAAVGAVPQALTYDTETEKIY